MKRIQSISVIGAGSWGTAIAEAVSRAGRDVTLYARDAGLAAIINERHENTTYLPGASLNPAIAATGDAAVAVKDADMVIFVTPAQYMRETMVAFKPHLPINIPVLSSSKGIEIATGCLLAEVAAEVLSDHPYGVLSGPSFAAETVRGLPTGITLASKSDDAKEWAKALHAPFFRPYLSDDPVGAEVAGAVKNVIAIACGIVEGLRLGQNAQAAVMTRGMAEIKRYGLARGAMAETFLGLSGLGDLTLTCHSMTSRNFSLGAELGQGKTLADILSTRRTVAEGVATAKAIAADAKKRNIDMPISLAVNAILHDDVPAADMVRELLSRDIKHEAE